VSITGRGSSSTGQPKGEPAALGRPVAPASWLSGRRRNTKGWGPLVSEGEGEGRAGPSRPGGQGPKGVWGELAGRRPWPRRLGRNLRRAQFNK
jgi:hypothetical protein